MNGLLLMSLVNGYSPGMNKIKRPLRVLIRAHADTLVPQDISKLKVVDLKDMLKAKGLKVSGTKGELVERLISLSLSSQSPILPELSTGATVDVPIKPNVKKTSLLTDEDLFAPPGSEPEPVDPYPRPEARKNTRPPVFTNSPKVSLEESSSSVVHSSGSDDGESSSRGEPIEQRGNNKVFDMQSEFGSRGHDYIRRSTDTSEVDEAVVDALLSERLEFKLTKQFRDADELEDKLLNMGVRVNDNQGEWFTFTKSAGAQRGETGGELTARELYSFVPGDSPHSVNVEEAEKLVTQRCLLKKERRFDECDEIREILTSQGVLVHDRGRVWVIMHPAGHPYMPRCFEAAAASFGDKDKRASVDDLLTRIWKAKKNRNFDEADTARDELAGLGACYDDDSLTWDLLVETE